MSSSNPTNPLHLLVTIHIHRREMAKSRTKAKGKGKYQGSPATQKGRPMESMEVITKARLSGRGAVPYLVLEREKRLVLEAGLKIN